MFPIYYRMKPRYVKIIPSKVVASPIHWKQTPDALRTHAMLHFVHQTYLKPLSYRVINLALFSSFSYVDWPSLKTARKPLSWIPSSFHLSLARQKCQVRWQKVRKGSISALKSCSFAAVGTKFFNLISTANPLTRFFTRDIYVNTKIKLMIDGHT